MSNSTLKHSLCLLHNILPKLYKQPVARNQLLFLSNSSRRQLMTMSQQQHRTVSPEKQAISGDSGASNGEKQIDLHAMREPYGGKEAVLDESKIETKEPFDLFQKWFEEARTNGRQLEPNAVCVATASKDGRPSARMMLLKEFGPNGFKVYTSYNSRKGSDLDENPRACMLFYWDMLNQQVRVEGSVKRCSEEDNKAYFAERPKESQLSAVISRQSKPVESREELEREWHEMEAKKSSNDKVECPAYWGGYCLQPETFEFWKGHTNRLHDRILFRRPKTSGEKVDGRLTKHGENGWVYERLYP